MTNFILTAALVCATAAFAQDGGSVFLAADAGVATSVVVVSDPVVITGSVVDAGTIALADGGTVAAPSFDTPWASARGFYEAVRTGNGWLIAMFLLFLLVGVLRTGGKRLHAMIPDDTKHWFLRPIEKTLFFFFDTKIGGWVLNWLSAIGGCLSTAAMAGMPVDAASLPPGPARHRPPAGTSAHPAG